MNQQSVEKITTKHGEIYIKIAEIVLHWKFMPKSKQSGFREPGSSTSYDDLVKSVDKPLISVKIVFQRSWKGTSCPFNFFFYQVNL